MFEKVAGFEVIDTGARTFKYSPDFSLNFNGVSPPKVISESVRYLAVHALTCQQTSLQFFRLFRKFLVLMIRVITGTCLQRLSGALQASLQVSDLHRFISEQNRPKRTFSAEHLDRESYGRYCLIG